MKKNSNFLPSHSCPLTVTIFRPSVRKRVEAAAATAGDAINPRRVWKCASSLKRTVEASAAPPERRGFRKCASSGPEHSY
ncbi:hypothetical protein TNCT_370211 [Trichonephila clavata]|uniref:Uncharacterized protein n=1 Tax=Trichonephila clavata TaxID=2740835 RepID=A0A8X6F931_TRICU|nr:hypothetical protein TNCT_370211 [Trichonephila clavata]